MGTANGFTKFSAHDDEIAVEGYTPEQIEYHLAVIWKGGFVETIPNGPGRMMNGDFMFGRLTWKGHDFVDTLRDGEVWKKTKEGASKAGGWTADFLLEMGKAIIKQKAKDFLGIPEL
jgi:hypothetical protein